MDILGWLARRAASGDGKTIASPPLVPAGTDVRTLKDATGNVYGQELYAAAQKPEGQITEVCGVGYYK
jgi:hypothetical protein